MNATQLLTHFDRISEAPDAIPSLRRFILDLAVRGKLVEQDQRDEPAAELLRRIERDVSERKTRGQYSEPLRSIQIPVSSLPFVVPQAWGWGRLVEIADVTYGFAFESSRFNSMKTGKPLIRIRDISNTDTEAYYDGHYDKACLVHNGDYLVGMDGDFNVRKWNGPEALLNQRVMRINKWRASVISEFLAIPLQKILDHLHGSTSLTTVNHLSAKQVNGIYLPLPPLAEQQRIVAKVDELMAMCDQLETAQAERESRRDQLAMAVHASLSNSSSPIPHSAFFINHLPRLTTKPEHIQQLRQTIFNLAVRGKLVSQDPKDEPTPVFGNEKPAEENNRIQLRLPSGWSWARVEDVAEARLGKMLDKAKNSGKAYRYLRNTNIHWFDVRMDDLKTLRIDDSEIEKYMLRNGDVLICEGGHGIGRTAVWRGVETDIIFQKALHRVRPARALNSEFFAYCIHVYFHAGVLRNYFTGVGIPHFTGVALSKLVFPLPPLAEQYRIVAKVDELMTLCDRLECQLTTSQTKSRRILEASLHELLEKTEGYRNSSGFVENKRPRG
jgi:type I restriction enzyme S subunit